jgi:hypothetical protein
LKAVLLPKPPETRTVLYTAKQRIECAVCEDSIYTDEDFTLALAVGHGRVRVPHCKGCRPFQVLNGYQEQTT